MDDWRASGCGRLRRVRWIGALVIAFASAAHAQEPIPGAVVAVGSVDADAATEAARAAGGARWSIERLEPRAMESPVPPDASALREAYLAADFLRCLTAAQEPALELGALLRAGHRETAVDVAVFGAACAFAGGDADLGRRLIERAFVAELDVSAALAVTTPDFQSAAEEVRANVAARARVDARIETRPAGARAVADGGARCAPTPCTLALLPGPHAIAIARLGYAPRAIELEAGSADIALDPAPSALVRSQLAAALARGMSPGDVELARAAASAFEARVVVVVWQSDRSHALAYDRARDRVLARVASSDVASAVRAVIAEWRGIVEPTPIYEEPLLWILTGAAAIAAGVIIYFAVRPPDRRYDLVFRFR